MRPRFRDMTFLASLDFPPLELGFGFGQPSLARRSEDASGSMGSMSASARGHGVTTLGDNNRVARVTMARMGEMGIVTSQRSNEISYTHVYDGGLIGLDHACVHADNTCESTAPWSCTMVCLPWQQLDC